MRRRRKRSWTSKNKIKTQPVPLASYSIFQLHFTNFFIFRVRCFVSQWTGLWFKHSRLGNHVQNFSFALVSRWTLATLSDCIDCLIGGSAASKFEIPHSSSANVTVSKLSQVVSNVKRTKKKIFVFRALSRLHNEILNFALARSNYERNSLLKSGVQGVSSFLRWPHRQTFVVAWL